MQCSKCVHNVVQWSFAGILSFYLIMQSLWYCVQLFRFRWNCFDYNNGLIETNEWDKCLMFVVDFVLHLIFMHYLDFVIGIFIGTRNPKLIWNMNVSPAHTFHQFSRVYFQYKAVKHIISFCNMLYFIQSNQFFLFISWRVSVSAVTQVICYKRCDAMSFS